MSTCSPIDKPVRRKELTDAIKELCERRSTVDLLLRELFSLLSKGAHVSVLDTCLGYSSESLAELREVGFPRRLHKTSKFTDYLEAFGETAFIFVFPPQKTHWPFLYVHRSELVIDYCDRFVNLQLSRLDNRKLSRRPHTFPRRPGQEMHHTAA